MAARPGIADRLIFRDARFSGLALVVADRSSDDDNNGGAGEAGDSVCEVRCVGVDADDGNVVELVTSSGDVWDDGCSPLAGEAGGKGGKGSSILDPKSVPEGKADGDVEGRGTFAFDAFLPPGDVGVSGEGGGCSSDVDDDELGSSGPLDGTDNSPSVAETLEMVELVPIDEFTLCVNAAGTGSRSFSTFMLFRFVKNHLSPLTDFDGENVEAFCASEEVGGGSGEAGSGGKGGTAASPFGTNSFSPALLAGLRVSLSCFLRSAFADGAFLNFRKNPSLDGEVAAASAACVGGIDNCRGAELDVGAASAVTGTPGPSEPRSIPLDWLDTVAVSLNPFMPERFGVPLDIAVDASAVGVPLDEPGSTTDGIVNFEGTGLDATVDVDAPSSCTTIATSGARSSSTECETPFT